MIETLGADDCFDYREEGCMKQIARLSDDPNKSIHLYFDNVGGETLDAALQAMAPGGRIACCGAISGYSGNATGLKMAHLIVGRRLSLQGYIAFPSFWPSEVFQGAIGQLAQWAAQKKISTRFHFHEKVGVEHFTDALVGLFAGKNQGKMLLQVDEAWKDAEKEKDASRL